MNRIEKMVATAKDTVKEQMFAGNLTVLQLEKSRNGLDMTFEEHFRFQGLKSQAVLENMLAVEEGQTLYVMLGETVSHANSLPFAHKYVLNKIFMELLKWRTAQVTS